MTKFQKNSIGTTLFLEIQGSEKYEKIFQQISDFLDFFEGKFSRFKKDNWLYFLNKNKTAELDEYSREMCIFMQKIARESKGFFDPTIGKRLTELGYGNQEIFFSPEAFNHRNFDEIVHFDKNFAKIILSESAEIEFGGLWKWYLIDWIFGFLEKELRKNENFLINFGGDMRSRGAFKIALESPFTGNEAIGIIILENQSLACTAPTRRKFNDSHHLINPFSRESSDEIISTFVVVDGQNPNSAMTADAWATTLSVMDFEKAKNFLMQKSSLEGMIVKKNGEFFRTEKSGIGIF